MNISEFEFVDLDKSQYAFSYWRWKKHVRTPLGNFSVELFHEGALSKNHLPDEEMLRRAAELVRYAETQGEYILDIVFGAYRDFLNNVDHQPPQGIPANLTRETVGQLIENPSLSVTRNKPSLITRLFGGKEFYQSSIVTPPLWDEEHGFGMEFKDGRIVGISDGTEEGIRFTLEAGVLRYPESTGEEADEEDNEA